MKEPSLLRKLHCKTPMEATADIDIIWPLQDDSCLTANAEAYVDDYVQAIEFEQYFDSTLMGSDTLYPDLYGATVDWEPVLQRKYAPETRTEHLSSSPFLYSTSTTAVARTEYNQHQTLCTSPAHLGMSENFSATNGDLSTTATAPLTAESMRAICFSTPRSHAVLLQLSSEAANEKEIWVSPRDLVLRSRRETGSMQARETHERDVSRRYLRAEHEIASLARKTYHIPVTTQRKGGKRSKKAGTNRQKIQSS
ncbi:hypothetical protein J3E74DRAFT_295620 [Bipolaris maydis]|nr:hypothetical protein J3E74DRAFT_295620 [Bipolaris maydis]